MITSAQGKRRRKTAAVSPAFPGNETWTFGVRVPALNRTRRGIPSYRMGEGDSNLLVNSSIAYRYVFFQRKYPQIYHRKAGLTAFCSIEQSSATRAPMGSGGIPQRWRNTRLGTALGKIACRIVLHILVPICSVRPLMARKCSRTFNPRLLHRG
jgi:hypothetical protein